MVQTPWLPSKRRDKIISFSSSIHSCNYTYLEMHSSIEERRTVYADPICKCVCVFGVVVFIENA